MNVLRIGKPLLAGAVIFLMVSCMSSGPPPYNSADKGEKASRMDDAPIVLVHGFLGFDAEHIVKFPYWGGATDLEKELRAYGYPVHTAAVGPVSSNWDRACELYAFIRGGRVDYGAAHSAEYGHARFGREYPGILPEWGSSGSANGGVHKVHLIGHSMGGQTARLLVELLEYGDPAERETSREDISDLFAGGHSWVKSVTSISTPHDGTSLVYDYADMGFLKKLFARMVAVLSLKQKEPALDLMIEHWEAAKSEDESLESFVRRAIREELWKNTRDFCYFDLSPEGAALLNARAAASPHVYYFSWGTSRTAASGAEGHHVPMSGMNLPLHHAARFMGSLEDLPRDCGPASEWWENDGVVNICSMDGPSLSSKDRIVRRDMVNEEPQPGVWNYMGTLKPLDHWQVHIASTLDEHTPPGFTSLSDFYMQWCGYLQKLPE